MKDLKSPLYEALKTGLTAMMPSECFHAGDHVSEAGRRVAGHEIVGDVHGQVTEFHHVHGHGVAGRGQPLLGCRSQLVRKQAARRRHAQAGGKNGDTAGFHGVLLKFESKVSNAVHAFASTRYNPGRAVFIPGTSAGSRTDPPGRQLTDRAAVCQTAVMAENKTQATGASVEEFLAGVEHPVRRRDGYRLWP